MKNEQLIRECILLIKELEEIQDKMKEKKEAMIRMRG